MTELDRMRHLYVIGQTGTGKSKFLTNLIIQDIQAGNGVCMIDPHGTDIEDVLGLFHLSEKKMSFILILQIWITWSVLICSNMMNASQSRKLL